MEAGKMDGPGWSDGFDMKFFEIVRDHSMQAFYGSPVHGGNRNKISYKMLKLDYPLIIGQNRYKT
jgi:gluconate 2-dehydrogenase gamma chain